MDVRINAETQEDAERDLLACCASRRWASEVAARRPYPDAHTLLRVSDAVLAALDWADVLRALSAHPRIGERVEGDGREIQWSRAEQSSAATTDEQQHAELIAGNAEYERRFGHVFLICASGLSAGEVLAALRARQANDDETERAVVRAELAKIVRLRLTKLVG